MQQRDIWLTQHKFHLQNKKKHKIQTQLQLGQLMIYAENNVCITVDMKKPYHSPLEAKSTRAYGTVFYCENNKNIARIGGHVSIFGLILFSFIFDQKRITSLWSRYVLTFQLASASINVLLKKNSFGKGWCDPKKQWSKWGEIKVELVSKLLSFMSTNNHNTRSCFLLLLYNVFYSPKKEQKSLIVFRTEKNKDSF